MRTEIRKKGNKEKRKKGKKEKRKKLSALQVYLVPHWIPVLPGLIIGRVGICTYRVQYWYD